MITSVGITAAMIVTAKARARVRDRSLVSLGSEWIMVLMVAR